MHDSVVLKVTLLTFMILLIKCSRVIDKHQQKSYDSVYCRKIGVCDEGTHVACTHFNRNQEMGPTCIDVKNVSITEEYAEMILDILNAMRSRTARGTSRGLFNLTLPRGYGIMRLQWDPELSKLAQLWANQCTIGLDECRATVNFPDPGQVAGLTRFNLDWLPINAMEIFNYTGFSLEKVKYGIHSALRAWYRSKDDIHPDDIKEGNFIMPTYMANYAFMQIVHGPVTHAGCGLTVSAEYSYHPPKEHVIHHMVRVVCNLSSRFHREPKQFRVYRTEPPKEVGYTAKCGCPIGYDEDEDCLCYKSGRKLPYSCKGKNCKPAVVVLPIFTVENAPPPNQVALFRNETNPKIMKTNEIDQPDSARSRRHDLRGSIFLKPSVFELPLRKLKTNAAKEKVNKFVKKDVSPRRDFSNIHTLMSNYLNKRRNIINMKAKIIGDINEFNRPSKESNITNETSTQMPNLNFDIKLLTKDTNNKLMYLLNKLEEEAKYYQVSCDKKDVFDRKLRKIYKTFVEKTSSPRKSRNAVPHAMLSINEFHENDRLHNYEEQFNRIRENNFHNFEFDHHPIRNNHRFKDFNKSTIKGNFVNDNLKQNAFTYGSTGKVQEIQNIDGLRKNFDRKEKESVDRNDEKYLLRSEDDILTLDKRTFYQKKLNNLERKLREFRNYRNRKNMHAEHHFRRMLPTYRELQQSRKITNINRF